MNNRIPLSWVILTIAIAPALNALGLPQSAGDNGSSYEQQSPQSSTSTCLDGSPSTGTGDGGSGCAATQSQQTSSQSGLETRRATSAGAQENSEISDPLGRKSSLQTQSLPPEPLTEFQKFVAATTGQLLPIYGANLFRNVPSTFAPNDIAPVTSDYVIGPDDELRVRIWGQVTYSGNLRVDRSGDIYLPEVGLVHVAGLPFSALDQHLREAAARIYRNFDLSADVGRIRSMQIYVTGQARRPGVYTVSSLSSLVDALFAAGGPSAQGSLRHIELRRNGKTVADFDLYALLIHGDKSNDARLLPEDVLFIPPVGAQVAVTGSVHTPGIYELHGTESIADILHSAGETTTLASKARISLERTGERQLRQAMEFSLDAAGLSTPLVEGDIVRVYSIAPAYRQTVTLRGDVANPGRFAWHQGMHLSDLIPDRDSLLSRDYWWRRSHLGLPAPEFEPLISHLESVQRRPLLGSANPNAASAEGGSGSSPYSDGQPNSLNGNSGQVAETRDRRTYQDPMSPAAQDALTAGLDAASADNSQGGLGGDFSGIGQASSQNSGRSGSLAAGMNQTSIPGSANQSRKTTVRISAPEIDWNYAVIERLDPDTLKTSLIPFDLGKLVINHDAAQDLPVQPADTVTIFSQGDIRVPLEEQTKYVYLDGEFVHSGIYSVGRGETLRDLVRRAGGFTGSAYLFGSEFDRESTRVIQQERIDEYVRRVDIEAERGNLALTANPTSSSGTLASATAASTAEQALIARLRQIRATGRIVLNFRPETASIDDVPPISLENGDRFIVPTAPSTINVVGAVYDQNAFLYRTGGSTEHYLQLAGGPDRDADWRRTFVIRADGSVVNRDAVKGPWGNTFKTLKLNPGDTIIVPDKTIRPTALRGLLDWTQIFSQLAIGAAAVNVLR